MITFEEGYDKMEIFKRANSRKCLLKRVIKSSVSKIDDVHVNDRKSNTNAPTYLSKCIKRVLKGV